jgi:hypothetical protein
MSSRLEEARSAAIAAELADAGEVRIAARCTVEIPRHSKSQIFPVKARSVPCIVAIPYMLSGIDRFHSASLTWSGVVSVRE